MSGPLAAVLDASQASSPLSVPLERTALLLMDYAHLTAGIVGERGPAAVAHAGTLRDWALEQGISIYHCSPDTSSTDVWPPYAKYAATWQKIVASVQENPTLGEEPAEIAIKDRRRETVVKRRPGHLSVLNSAGLLDDLQAKNVRSLILAGFTTGGCVLSTVRNANDHDFIVTVAEDACADAVPEVHRVLTKYTFLGTAHVAPVQDIIEAWAKVAQ